MVDVEWDLEGGDLDQTAAEKAVGRVIRFYQRALSATICPVHSREPWLKVKGRTLPNLVVSIEACCEELLRRAQARVGDVSRRAEDDL
jgi:hypothetical protein